MFSFSLYVQYLRLYLKELLAHEIFFEELAQRDS